MSDFLFAAASVIAPAEAVHQHVMIQQHVQALYQEPEFRNKHAIIAIKQADMRRVFWGDAPKQFYMTHGQHLLFVSQKSGTDAETYFGTAIALSNDVMTLIMHDDTPALALAGCYIGDLPKLRFTILVSEVFLEGSPLKDYIELLTPTEFNATLAASKFNSVTQEWEVNKEPEEQVKIKLHLKDIPLNTRANRRLVRDTLVQHDDALQQKWTLWLADKTPEQELEFDEWLEQHQGVQIKVLRELSLLDALADDKYVDAMVTFKKAQVQAMHSQAVKDKQTELHLFDWTLENFKEEFNDLGRKEAEKDIEGISTEQAAAEEEPNEKDGAIFVVSFDGTIVENQKPLIGPATPFAIDVLKALMANGHVIIILTDRDEEELDRMLKFFVDGHDFMPHAVVNSISANDTIDEMNNGLRFVRPLDGSFLEQEDDGNLEENGLDFDYLIDHRHFGAPTMNLSGGSETTPTLYWGELASQLVATGYLAPDTVGKLQESLAKAD